MPQQVPPEGSSSSRIMIVGEAPGEEEERKLRPFVGNSGYELERMLGEAKILRSECFITNVARERPFDNDIKHFFAKSKKALSEKPEKFPFKIRGKPVTRELYEGFELLKREIELVKPNIIIALGNTSMWALTGKGGEKYGSPGGIKKWRGSMLHEDLTPLNCQVIPTYHPAFVLRTWNVRSTTVTDLRRAARFRTEKYPKPEWNFRIRPTYYEALAILEYLLKELETRIIKLSFDLETANGHIHCAGLAWSLVDAICIPIISAQNRKGYWTEDEEARLVYLLYLILTHKNARVIGQNLLYDCQYTYRHWHFVPKVTQDTMISQHSFFSDLPKSLAYQSSVYCSQYVFWKEEGKTI